MKKFIQTYYDRLVLGTVTCALAVSTVWFAIAQNEYRQIRALPVALHLSGPAYDPEPTPQVLEQRDTWFKPGSQSTGAEWCYELFSPPTVCRDKSSGLLTVVSPLFESRGKPEQRAIALLEVTREPYRLQLTGYVGEAGAYSAILTGLGGPGGVLAEKGDRLADAGVTVQSVLLRKVARESAVAGEGYEVAALVELFDERSGRVVMLDSRLRKFTDTLFAKVRLGTIAQGNEREVREGETISDDASSYLIQRITTDSVEVAVSRLSADEEYSETLLLRAVDVRSATTQSDESKFISSRPATGLFTNAR